MALGTYHRKRDFTKTAEPRGGKPVTSTGHLYLIQKHAARRLHYDLRLELDGVLVSWAVTRGPSLVPGEKRLAVHVEDHPLEYGGFEGTIPAGEYGGGTVILWDLGQWEPIGDPRKSMKKGRLDFRLHGKKLQGLWHLIRIQGKPGEKRDNWLLIKSDDDAARRETDPDILAERPESVKTGREIQDVANEMPTRSSKKVRLTTPVSETVDIGKITGARKQKKPDFVAPALATLSAHPPRGQKWIHEIKFDGYRLQAHIDRQKVDLLSRGALNWTSKFGRILTDALLALPVSSAIIDGEVVVEGANGASDFSMLQGELKAGRSNRFLFYLFDLIHLNGYDLRNVPLFQRKTLLQNILNSAAPPLRFSEHFEADADLVFTHACRLSLEGILSKLRDAPYHSGRSKDWLKSKCSERQEFVIGGYVPSSVIRGAIGSLLMGLYDKKKKLVYVGRVGTGYTQAMARDLFRRLDKMRQSASPFSKKLSVDQARDVQFIRPELIAEIEFRSWTADRNLRHAAFRGLREDKPASEIIGDPQDDIVAAPQPRIKLTHPDRLYWPDAGVTKMGLADYYADVWPHIAPFIVHRPLSVVRCPDGIGGQCFFQKHAWNSASKVFRLARDPKGTSNDPILTIDSLDGLIGLVQGAVLEIHPWGSTLATLEQPDMIIMDLDPGPGVVWAAVIAAAHELRERLQKLGLSSYVKTSGGKGLHIVSPLTPKADWRVVKSFTKSLATAMAADSPDLYVATVTKSKRVGKIFIDYLRNGRGATAVAPYSTRARPLAPVSMPLFWDELKQGIGPDYFTLSNAQIRLGKQKADPWADFRKTAAPLHTE